MNVAMLERTGEEDIEVAAHWPMLERIGLSSAAKTRRRSYIGGSDANQIVGGDPDRLLRLWRSKRGEDAEELPSTLAMVMGNWTEDLNRQWFERETRMAVSEMGLFAVSDVHGWRSATLDGVVEERGAIWEAKHVSAFAKSEEVLARYLPQLQHNMAVAGREHAILSVRGGSGNLHSGDKWIADLTAAMLAASRRQDEQATTPEPQPGVQGQGGVGCGER